MTLRLGYKASAEQFPPRRLLDLAVAAEGAGFDSVWTSDHFQPWRHTGGHAPSALVWLGAAAQATTRVTLGTSVLTPSFRYNPAVVAQAFATLACLAPGENLVFAATGVTAGDLLHGVLFFGGGARTHSLVMAYQAKQVRFVDTVHMFDRDSPPRVRL